MNIVVLDGLPLNPGDLSWEELEALGPCVVHERTAPEQVVARSRKAEIVLTNKTVLDRAVLAQLPNLRYIGVLATGTNVVDLDAAREQGVIVSHVPAYSTASVAQLVFALLLELTRHVGHHARTVREGRWSAGEDFCYWDRPQIELDGFSLGVVGLGRIGRAVARIAQAFGMTVMAYTRSGKTGDGVEPVDLETLLRQSDVVSLHCPLTTETERMIDKTRLAWMKPTAFLINTARGPLIDEPALAEALNTGRLAGAGLDVLSTEPPSPDNPLLTAKNGVITPHLAWATHAARARLMRCVTANVRAFLAGTPENVVNPEPPTPRLIPEKLLFAP